MTGVPAEYLGLARAFRAGLVAGHGAAVDAVTDSAVPLYRRSRLGQAPSPAALARAAGAWRAVPGPGRLSLKVSLGRGALAIDELRAAPADFRFEAWADGDAELAVLLLRVTLRASAADFFFDMPPVASVPLHALARRVQRGFDNRDAALRADLRALARHPPPEAGDPFVQPGADGSWAGVVAAVPRGEAGHDRVLVARTWLAAGMETRVPLLLRPAAVDAEPGADLAAGAEVAGVA